jgi:IS5 family transposase
MNRCLLKGAKGDSLHAVLCAAGFNTRCLAAHEREKGHRPFLRLLQASGLGPLTRQWRQIFV